MPSTWVMAEEDYTLLDKFPFPPGWFTDEEVIHLFMLCRGLPLSNARVVEIGSWMGKTATVMARALIDRDNPRISCVDPWDARGTEDIRNIESGREAYMEALNQANMTVEDLYPEFLKNIQKCKVDHLITPCRGTSEEWAPKFKDESLDLVFIDGDHHEDMASLDIKLWGPKLKRGGVMAIHDVYMPGDDVTQPGWCDGPFKAIQKGMPLTQWGEFFRANALMTARRRML